MEEWHERLFEILQRDPAPNAMPVTMHQLKEADKMLFRKLAEKTRGKLSQQIDGTKHIKTFLQQCMDHAEVQFCLIPMVKAVSRSAAPEAPSTVQRQEQRQG